MPHRADERFFESKREWSRRKDQILAYYLKPYIPKVARLGRPLLLVDGFAGPGKFRDGSAGSPLIMRKIIEGARASNPSLDCKLLLIESDDSLATALNQLFQDVDYATIRSGKFIDQVDFIESIAETSTVFLYLDPFTVDGLEWESLERIFRLLKSGSSIEVLMNLNVDSFGRRARALLRDSDLAASSFVAADDAVLPTPTSAAKLTRVVGGDWWQGIFRSDADYSEQVSELTERFCSQMRSHFAEVCTYEVRERSSNQVPKYVLVFGSRHGDALMIMNDAMVSGRKSQADWEAPLHPVLFELRSELLVPDLKLLPKHVLSTCEQPMSRKELASRVVRLHFGKYSTGEISSAVKQLVAIGLMGFRSATKRLNDAAIVWRSDGRGVAP